MANMLMGLSSILCILKGHHYCASWLLLIGYLLDLADGAVARQLNACSSLGAKLDDFADFTTFGIASSLLLPIHSVLDGLLAICYIMTVFTRLCFFSSGIPFMYRGLPCTYASAILACTNLLSGGNLQILQLTAILMVLLMVDKGLYPHDKILESQGWKKLVYAGGELPTLTHLGKVKCSSFFNLHIGVIPVQQDWPLHDREAYHQQLPLVAPMDPKRAAHPNYNSKQDQYKRYAGFKEIILGFERQFPSVLPL
ncbi:TM269 protein, partial [Polypterus senegalus]